MNNFRYFALVAAAGMLMNFAQPAMAAPAAAPSAAASAAPAKAAVATATGAISNFSKGKWVTLKNADPKAKNVTYYISKSTVVTGTLAKGANATITYNPNVAKGAKIQAVRIVVAAAK